MRDTARRTFSSWLVVRIAAIGLVVGAEGTDCRAGELAFAVPELIPFENATLAFAVADVDGDGILDLIAARDRPREIVMASGRGDGRFGERTSIPIENVAEVVLAADLDADGATDLLAGGSGVWRAFLGDGRGGFLAQPEFPVAGDLEAAELALLGPDEYLDCVISSGDDVLVLPGHGDGTFGAATSYGPPGAYGELFVADIDRDGFADVVVTDRGSSSVLLLRGDGVGGFLEESRSFAAGPEPFRLEVADWSGDGWLDVVTIGYREADTWLLLGDGAGGFAGPERIPTGAQESGEVVAGDFDGDGIVDLAVSDRVLLGRGDGTFRDGPIAFIPYGPQRMASADVDADGRDDLLGSLRGLGGGWLVSLCRIRESGAGDCDLDGMPDAGQIAEHPELDANRDGILDRCEAVVETVVDCNGNGLPDHEDVAGGASDDCDANGIPDECETTADSMKFGDTGVYLAGDTVRVIRTADLNRDGVLDVLCGNEFSPCVSVLLGDGGRGYRDVRSFGPSRGARDIAIGDFDGDGFDDVAVAQIRVESLYLLLGDGAGGLLDGGEVGTFFLPPRACVAVDFDGDGVLDVLTAQNEQGVAFLQGLGGGSFAAPQFFDGYGERRSVVDLNVGDLDGDDILDIVAGTHEQLVIFPGAGDGAVHAPRVLRLDSNPYPIELADLDENDLLDIVVGGAALTVLSAAGDGTFTATRRLSLEQRGFAEVVVRDLDGDGHADLLATTSGRELVAMFGHGGAGLESPRVGLVESPVLAVSDLDGTGNPALLSGSADLRGILVSRGPAGGIAQRPALAARTRGGRGLVVTDVNGDGRADVLSSHEDSEVQIRLCGADGYFRDGVPVALEDRSLLIVSGDFNADERPDLIVHESEPAQLVVLQGDGDGAFSRSGAHPIVPLAGGGNVLLEALQVGDLDGDGDEDVLAQIHATSVELHVYISAGDGTFEVRRSDSCARRPLLADVDGDALLDIVGGTDSLCVHLAAEGLEAAPAVTTPVSIPFTYTAVGDVDGDGLSEVVLTTPNLDGVVVYHSRGDGTFRRGATVPVGDSPGPPAIALLDGDSIPDLAVPSYGDAAVKVLSGRGDGAFRLAANLPAGESVRSLLARDIDGDGLTDLAADVWERPSATIVYYNRSITQAIDCDGDGVHDVCEIAVRPALDCDGDGALDDCEIASGVEADCNENGVPDACELATGGLSDTDGNGVPDLCDGQLQVPGDCTQDGRVDISDGICLLGILFLRPSAVSPCRPDAPADDFSSRYLLDWQGDGALDISDAISLLNHLFLGAPSHSIVARVRDGCAPVPGCSKGVLCD